MLDRSELVEYRRRTIAYADNRALAACAEFRGDVLLVESEHDDIVPPAVTANYQTAFAKARSLTPSHVLKRSPRPNSSRPPGVTRAARVFRVLESADHGLSEEEWQNAYTSLFSSWVGGTLPGARRRS